MHVRPLLGHLMLGGWLGGWLAGMWGRAGSADGTAARAVQHSTHIASPLDRAPTSWLHLSWQIAMTGVVVVESYLSCPSIPDQKTHKLHDALQAFAWWVGVLAARLPVVVASLPASSAVLIAWLLPAGVAEHPTATHCYPCAGLRRSRPQRLRRGATPRSRCSAWRRHSRRSMPAYTFMATST